MLRSLFVSSIVSLITLVQSEESLLWYTSDRDLTLIAPWTNQAAAVDGALKVPQANPLARVGLALTAPQAIPAVVSIVLQ